MLPLTKGACRCVEPMILTPGGRVREVYDKLLAGLSTFDKYAQRIGLERLAKNVADTFDAAIAREPEAR